MKVGTATLRAATGLAWNEATVRGRLVAEYRRGATKVSLRAQRSLDLTNDFRNPFDSGSTLGAMFGADDYDYLDRRSIMLQWWRLFGDRERTQLRFESGPVDERDVEVNLRRSPLGVGEDFRENRPVTAGRYVRSVLTFDHRPDVSLEFLRPGFGARAHYERGDGGLNYQRMEVRSRIPARHHSSSSNSGRTRTFPATITRSSLGTRRWWSGRWPCTGCRSSGRRCA